MKNKKTEELEYAIRHLADSDERTRQSAIAMIRSDPDESMRYLIESLQTNPSFRWKALCALRCLDENLIDALPVVIPHLHDEHRLCRIEAVELIAQMGMEAKAAVPDMIKLLDNKDEAFRTLVLKGLGRIGLGPADTAAITPLGKILRQEICKDDEPSGEVVRNVSALLRAIGSSSIPTFVSCLRKVTRSPMFQEDDYESWLFEPVFEALVELLPMSKGASKQLLSLLALPRSPLGLRKDVLSALGWVGPTDADRVVRALIEFRNDRDYGELFIELFGAFARIGPGSVPILIQILSCHDDTKSVFAAQVLGSYNDPAYPIEVSDELRQAAKASIPALIAAFQAGGWELKESCAWALGTMSSDAKEAVPILTAAVDDPCRNGKSGLTQTSVQEAARRALKLILDN